MSMSAVPSTEPGRGHARLMDKVYGNKRYLYDFTRKYYLFGRDGLIRDLTLKPGDRLVEIGCGTGRNLVAIAKAHPEVLLFGLDASAEMLKTARDRVRRAALDQRITLVHGLAEQLIPGIFAQDAFEHAFFSYSLSMIPGWREALAAARATLVPNGRLHLVDFGDFGALPYPFRGLLEHWLAKFHVTPRVELLSELEQQNAEKRQLKLLPGRYAFTYSG